MSTEVRGKGWLRVNGQLLTTQVEMDIVPRDSEDTSTAESLMKVSHLDDRVVEIQVDVSKVGAEFLELLRTGGYEFSKT